MKKKTRIIGSISALAMSAASMAMLTCGVLAASQVSLDVTSSVSFEAKAPDYLEWDENGYWTLTMGEYQGAPLVWRMVLKEEENNDVSSVANYTQNTTLSGSYYFLLDTHIEDVLECAFENNYTDSTPYPRLDEYKSTVNVNDYAVSNIREYLTGTDVYRGYAFSDPNRIPELATGQTEPENFLDKFNITSSPVYSMIEGRSLSDLYSRMAALGRAVEFDTDVENGVGELAGIDPDTTKDKLWLLSYYEANKMGKGARRWDADYWLRSPYSAYTNYVYYVYASGLIGTNNNAYDTYCARPAFKISIN